MKSKGKRYSDEFKADVIKMVKESGHSVPVLAKDLGINSQTIYNWLGEHKDKQNPDKVRIAELEAELKKEKHRTADLEETVTILKKATAIFATNNRK